MINNTLGNSVSALGALSSVVGALPPDVPAWVQTIGDHVATVHLDSHGRDPGDVDAAWDELLAAFHALHVGGDVAQEGDPAFMPGFRVWSAGVALAGWDVSVVVRSDA